MKLFLHNEKKLEYSDFLKNSGPPKEGLNKTRFMHFYKIIQK